MLTNVVDVGRVFNNNVSYETCFLITQDNVPLHCPIFFSLNLLWNLLITYYKDDTAMSLLSAKTVHCGTSTSALVSISLYHVKGCASKKECIMQEVLFSNTFLKNVRKINTFYIVVASNGQTWYNHLYLCLEISEYDCGFSVIITTSGWPVFGHGVSYLANLLDLCTSCGYSKFAVYYAVIDIISSIKDVWFSSQYSAVKTRM